MAGQLHLPGSTTSKAPAHERVDSADAFSSEAFEGAAALPSIVSTLEESAAGLGRICQESEADFLELGNRLNAIHGEADELTRKVVALLTSGREETAQGALRSIQEHAREALAEIHRQRLDLAEDAAGLQHIHSDLAALCEMTQHFRQISKNLKMVGMNIHIESARSETAKMMFQALAEEITELSRTVHSVAGLIRDDTEEARRTIAGARAEIEKRLRHLDELLDSAEKMVQRALLEVDRLMGLNMNVLNDVGFKAGEIREQVGLLVVGIQIHDSISQRATHVNNSIAEALDMIRAARPLDLPPTALSAVMGRVYGINRIQCTHLKTIVDDVAEAGRQSRRALDRLLVAVRSMAQAQRSSVGSDGGVDPSGSRHPVAVLKHALEQLLALIDAGLADIGRLSSAREQTGRTVERLGRHIERVRDINFEIHLKALNAVIKSGRLGSTGRAIEAVVKEMKELAEQSNATIGSVAGIMEKIASASDGIDRHRRTQTHAAHQAGQMLRKGIDAFWLACGVFSRQSREAIERGGRLGEKISRTLQDTGFFDRMAEAFVGIMEEMVRLGDLLQPHAGPAKEWVEEEKRILARYTMQREREAHKLAVKPAHRQKPGAAAAEVVSSQEENCTSAAGEELDANVEIF